MIVKVKFEGILGGTLKKFSVGDTITIAEEKELNAEAKGFIKSEPNNSKGETEGAKS